MSPSPDAKQPMPLATKIGFALWGLALLWWFAYYANYGGAFQLLSMKIYCINGASSECLFFRQQIGPAFVPTYYPIFWYAGVIALAVGVYQSLSARRQK